MMMTYMDLAPKDYDAQKEFADWCVEAGKLRARYPAPR